MKNSVFVILGLMMAGSESYAGDFRDAATICETMSFQSGKTQCIATARASEGQYFDHGAIQVCKSMSFDSGKNECISNIAGKEYENFEISNCASQSFDSSKNSCLSVAGKRYQPPSRPGRPGSPRPPAPPPPRQDHRSEDYVRGEVRSWERVGEFTAPKGFPQTVSIDLDSRRAVSQVRLSGDKAEAQISRAIGITNSGVQIRLSELEGTVLKGNSTPRRVHAQYAIRLQRIEFEVVSRSLTGSRAKVEVVIGYTR